MLQHSSTRTNISVFVTLLVITVLLFSGIFLTSGKPAGNSTSSSSAQSPCRKPANGYLIIANSQGFNDSIDHGAPTNNWPVITVQKGQEVSITVCNQDIQAHGFQIQHYLDSQIIVVAPGQVRTFSFVADQTGDFRIYCSIFCTVHIFMQSGLLVVK